MPCRVRRAHLGHAQRTCHRSYTDTCTRSRFGMRRPSSEDNVHHRRVTITFRHVMSRNVPPEDRLGDFTADSRLVTLSAMAALIGVISAGVAWALIRLIGLFTNLAYFHRLATTLVSPAASPLGPCRALLPFVGGLTAGLMAGYGPRKSRGRGAPVARAASPIWR